LHKEITYDENELWAEIDRILEEDSQNKFTTGTNLYYNLLLCSDSRYFVDSEINLYIEEYMAMKRFNIPIAETIDKAEYERLVVFTAIDEEYKAILRKEEDVKKSV
jgi:hypothetical protein|tara:strand:+ start:294 stop:611 length:318 start_codon:yes stop_codon:yes gene_type:complete